MRVPIKKHTFKLKQWHSKMLQPQKGPSPGYTANFSYTGEVVPSAVDSVVLKEFFKLVHYK